MIPASCAVVERVALRQLAQPPRGLGRHAHRRRGDGAPPRERLGADVDHADVARPRRRARGRSRGRTLAPASAETRSRSASCAASHARCRARAHARGSPRARSRRSPADSSSASWSASACPTTSNGLTVTAHSAELLAGAGVLGEDEHAVALVDERRLLRDQVHPVEDGVHEQHVVLLVGRDRAREVVLRSRARSAASRRSPKRSLTARDGVARSRAR